MKSITLLFLSFFCLNLYANDLSCEVNTFLNYDNPHVQDVIDNKSVTVASNQGEKILSLSQESFNLTLSLQNSNGFDHKGRVINSFISTASKISNGNYEVLDYNSFTAIEEELPRNFSINLGLVNQIKSETGTININIECKSLN